MTDNSSNQNTLIPLRNGNLPLVPDQKRVSLEILAENITTKFAEAKDAVIETAMMVHELRTRIEAGEAGENEDWIEWAKTKTKLSKTRLYELDAIGASNHPMKKAAEYRLKGAERQAKSRNNKGTPKSRETERLELIEWAKTAPLREVKHHWAQIQSASDARKTLSDADRDRIWDRDRSLLYRHHHQAVLESLRTGGRARWHGRALQPHPPLA